MTQEGRHTTTAPDGLLAWIERIATTSPPEFLISAFTSFVAIKSGLRISCNTSLIFSMSIVSFPLSALESVIMLVS